MTREEHTQMVDRMMDQNLTLKRMMCEEYVLTEAAFVALCMSQFQLDRGGAEAMVYRLVQNMKKELAKGWTGQGGARRDGP